MAISRIWICDTVPIPWWLRRLETFVSFNRVLTLVRRGLNDL